MAHKSSWNTYPPQLIDIKKKINKQTNKKTNKRNDIQTFFQFGISIIINKDIATKFYILNSSKVKKYRKSSLLAAILKLKIVGEGVETKNGTYDF